MKRLKTLLTAFLFVASTIKLATAYQLPLDRDGIEALNVQDVGVYVYLSTSHIPRLINGATQMIASDGTQIFGSSIAIYGVLTSTFSGDLASPAYVLLRATNTANTTSELLVPPISVGISSSITGPPVVAKNNLVLFDPPIIAGDGLSVNISSDVDAITTWRPSAAIFYRYLATNAPEDVWFPNDNRGMKTVGGASLYATSVSTDRAIGQVVNNRSGTEVLDFGAGPFFLITSTIQADMSPIMVYGWSASSGNATTWIEFVDATGITGVAISSMTPKIYPRTLGEGYDNYPWGTPGTGGGLSTYNSSGFNFPWPIVARRGVKFTVSTTAERYRLHTRNRRALR